MNHPLVPFIVLVGLVFAMGNGIGDPLDLPAANTGNQSTGHSTRSTYNNGYTDSGHQNTIIGDMVHQMRHEGVIQPETLDAGEDILWRCAKLDPAPPICN